MQAASETMRGPRRSRRWRVEAVGNDGGQLFVEAIAASGDAAMAAVASLGWIRDVTGSRPLGTLGEEVRVAMEGTRSPHGAALREAGGGRRWVPRGEPEEDWWAEVDASGNILPGDWEYDREAGSVVCSFVSEAARRPWTFTVELDGDEGARERLSGIASSSGCSRVSEDTWAAKAGNEVESQCLALSRISRDRDIMGHVLSMTAYEGDGTPVDCMEVLLKTRRGRG